MPIDLLDEPIIMLQGIDKKIALHINDNLLDWTETVVVEWIKRVAVASGLPNSFIKGIHVVKSGNNKVKIFNDWYGPKGEPLATFFNNGTKDHFILPLQNRPNASLKFPNNPPFKFSKGHKVKGLFASHAYENGIQMGNEFLVELIKTSAKLLVTAHRR